MNFYINVVRKFNKLLVRSIKDGKPYDYVVEDFKPTLYTSFKNSQCQGEEYSDIYGRPCYPYVAESISQSKDFIEQYSDVSGQTVYESLSAEYQYIRQTWPGEFSYDTKLVKKFAFDIETTTDKGFPEAENPEETITVLSIVDLNKETLIVFENQGLPFWKPYKKTQVILDYEAKIGKELAPKIIPCPNETELLIKFIDFFKVVKPHVITGWNTELFDIPYTCSRIEKLLGTSALKSLSPWGEVKSRKVEISNKEYIVYDIHGVYSLDYIDLYKKFSYGSRESYKLDYIMEYELGLNKIDMGLDLSFKDFYTQYWPEFVGYNAVDSDLILRLDQKLGFVDLAITMAYLAKCNYDDVLSPIKAWDCISFNYLADKGQVIPNQKFSGKTEKFKGAYVQEPITGKYKNIASYDLASLYPHLIMWANISPETIVDGFKYDYSVDDYVNGNVDLSGAKQRDWAVAASGYCFRKDIKGFSASMMEDFYAKRKAVKKQMLIHEQRLVKIEEEMKRRGI